jgi:hypothetical protein
MEKTTMSDAKKPAKKKGVKWLFLWRDENGRVLPSTLWDKRRDAEWDRGSMSRVWPVHPCGPIVKIEVPR